MKLLCLYASGDAVPTMIIVCSSWRQVGDMLVIRRKDGDNDMNILISDYSYLTCDEELTDEHAKLLKAFDRIGHEPKDESA